MHIVYLLHIFHNSVRFFQLLFALEATPVLGLVGLGQEGQAVLQEDELVAEAVDLSLELAAAVAAAATIAALLVTGHHVSLQ